MSESLIDPSGPDARPLVVCATIALSPDWRWFSRQFEQVRWEFFRANPRNRLERAVRRPNLAATRSCWEAVRCAQRNAAAMVISHDPRISYRCAAFMKLTGVSVPHVAWGFNFSSLPGGAVRRSMARAFARLDRVVVYSSMERSLYADHFGIDPKRIDVMLWGVGPPAPEPADTPLEQGPYISALGGNARDYRTLFAAMERLPEIRLVAVLRPENLAGLSPPSNVSLHFNVSKGTANNILKFSRFMVLPLDSSQVPCGHVTLVAAMFLGRAMIVSGSAGVADYVRDDENALLTPVGDAAALAQRIRALWEDPARRDRMGAAGLAFAREHCSEASVMAHLRRVLTDFGLPS